MKHPQSKTPMRSLSFKTTWILVYVLALGFATLNAAHYQTPTSKLQDVIIAEDSRVRLGGDTSIEQLSKKTVTLKRGVLLVEDSSGLIGRGTTMLTIENSTSVKNGSFVAEYRQGGYLKIICLAGTVTIKSKSLFAEYLELDPGQMLITSPSDKKLPDPVDIDLERFISSSRIVENKDIGLVNGRKVRQALEKQSRNEVKGRSTKTPIILPGRGLEVGVDLAYLNGNPALSQSLLAGADNNPNHVRPELIKDEIGAADDDRHKGSMGPSNPNISDPTEDFIINQMTQFDDNTKTLLTPGVNELTVTNGNYMGHTTYYQTRNLVLTGAVDFSPLSGTIIFLAKEGITIGNASPTNLFLGMRDSSDKFWFDANGLVQVQNATIEHSPESIYEVDFYSYYDNVTVNNSTFNINDLEFYAKKSISLQNSSMDATNAFANSYLSMFADKDLHIDNSSIGQTQPHQDVEFVALKNITITNSTSLKAIASLSIKGETVTMSAINAINSADIKIEAKDRLDITNVMMQGDIIKLGTTNAGGLLYIKDSSISATQQLLLYGSSSSGTVRFGGNQVNLNAPTININAYRVAIDDGTTVNNNGTTNINATVKDYNIPGSGNFSLLPP